MRLLALLGDHGCPGTLLALQKRLKWDESLQVFQRFFCGEISSPSEDIGWYPLWKESLDNTVAPRRCMNLANQREFWLPNPFSKSDQGGPKLAMDESHFARDQSADENLL